MMYESRYDPQYSLIFLYITCKRLKFLEIYNNTSFSIVDTFIFTPLKHELRYQVYVVF